jgi:hypothetical protein
LFRVPTALDSWGCDLFNFLAWEKATGKLFGLAGCDGESDYGVRAAVIEDVQRDVSALLAAADTRSVENSEPATRAPLSEMERAVFDLIPCGTGEGITGKEIINKLTSRYPGLSQSDLTKRIIPRLRAYGVDNRRAVGYYRIVMPP